MLATEPALTPHPPPKSGGPRQSRGQYEEKRSDVNLAVQLVLDACDDRFDTAIVVSGDSDLSTPVRLVRARFEDKRVLVAFPPARNSEDLKRAASGHFKIGQDKLRNSQFPETVVTPAGIHLARPTAWKQP